MWVTTWNVNGIRARKERVLNWIDSYYPTVLCLQETRCHDSQFPYNELKKYYPHIEHAGQKGSNGVAILSKHKIENVSHDPFEQSCRAIFGTVKDLRIGSVYVPQGQSLESDKFVYKQEWWTKFIHWLENEAKEYSDLVISGDYNICPAVEDVWSTKYWHDGVVSCTPLERKLFAEFQQKFELIDAIRSLTDEQVFTWWGYINFSMKYGVRIDHVMHSKGLIAKKFHVDKEERSNAKGASDHAPVSVNIK